MSESSQGSEEVKCNVDSQRECAQRRIEGCGNEFLGVLFEGAFPLGKALNDDQMLMEFLDFLELIKIPDVTVFGERLERLKNVRTTREENEVQCFKFYLENPDVARFFIQKGSTFFSKWKYNCDDGTLNPILPSEELNVRWHFSVTISNVGSSIGNLKKPLLIENDSSGSSNFLFNVPLVIDTLSSDPSSSKNLFEEKCAHLLALTCGEIGCDPEEITILVNRPNIPHTIAEGTNERSSPMVNRFDVQKALTSFGCFVASVYSHKKFECEMKTVRTRIFKSDKLKGVGATSSKAQAVISLLNSATQLFDEQEWKEVTIDGFKSTVGAREIKAHIRRYATKVETDFFMTKPRGAPFYGGLVFVTAPLITAKAVFDDPHLLMHLEEKDVHHLPLRFDVDRMNRMRKPYMLKIMNRSLVQLNKMVKRKTNSPSDPERKVEIDMVGSGVPRCLMSREELSNLNTKGPTPSESRDMRNQERNEKRGNQTRRKSKKKSRSPSDDNDPGVEETKSSPPPNASASNNDRVTSSVWNGNSGRGNSSNQSSSDESSLEDRLFKKLQASLEATIENKIVSILEKTMDRISSHIGTQIEQALGRLTPGALSLPPPQTVPTFSNMPPANFAQKPLGNRGTPNVFPFLPNPNCGPPQPYNLINPPQGQSDGSESADM